MPDGPPNPSDLLLRGEWEETAKTTALELRRAAIGLAGAAILISILLEARRRRGGRLAPLPPPPPAALAESKADD